MTYFEFISRAVVECKKKNDFINTWDNWGYLSLRGFNDNIRKKIAYSYYKMGCYLLRKKPNTITCLAEVDMCFLIFNIIRKVVINTETVLENPKFFLEFCMDYVRDMADHYEKIYKSCRDMETHLCSDISEYAIKIIKES